MIEDDGIIRFSPGDQPELPEIPASREHQDHQEPPAPPAPEPAGWRPLGVEW